MKKYRVYKHTVYDWNWIPHSDYIIKYNTWWILDSLYLMITWNERWTDYRELVPMWFADFDYEIMRFDNEWDAGRYIIRYILSNEIDSIKEEHVKGFSFH